MAWLEQVHLVVVGFLVPLAVLLVCSTATSTRRRRKQLPFPPGPTPLPIIGNMLIMNQLTHRGLAKLNERYGSGLCHFRLGARHAFSVSTPEPAREVLQAQGAVFSNRPASAAVSYLTYGRADMAFAHYGPFWRQARKLCVMNLFSRKRTASWASVQVELCKAVRAVAERADAGAAINVGELKYKMTMGIIFRAAFGTQSCGEQGELFIAVMQEFSRLFGAFNVGDFISSLRCLDPHGINRRLKAARGSLDKFINRIIDEHIANPKAEDSAERDIVDEMLVFLDEVDSGVVGGRTREEDELLKGQLRLTRNNIKAIIMDLMFGGTETVASAIEWAMAELMKNPDELSRVQEELTTTIGGLDRQVQESDLEKLPYLKCVVKETLRLHPPIPLLLHETAEESQVAGFSVPAESRVMINVWAIGRDRSVWKDAGEFRPARCAPGGEAAAVDFKGNFFEFLPFGSGRRSCPGMYLGLHALELAVAQMAHCFTWVLPGRMKPSELDMGDVFGLSAPRAVRLVAVPTHRLTCPLF
ncbi:cytochrome P450 84A1-like [Zingiber officinale]|uniref:cytochrome P450 84A1-like n=1 Tax=Zingiber officinale TaxID=94328 RepID=UPI001C4C0C78|nr:cytochrome P450 84A1-like [Zingiber officinale]